jgi:hypothetical protein
MLNRQGRRVEERMFDDIQPEWTLRAADAISIV